MTTVERMVAALTEKFDERGDIPPDVRIDLLNRILRLLPSEEQRVLFIGQLGLACAERSWPVWLAKFPGETALIDFARSAVTAITGGPPTKISWSSSDGGCSI